jgi:hypothetical protein
MCNDLTQEEYHLGCAILSFSSIPLNFPIFQEKKFAPAPTLDRFEDWQGQCECITVSGIEPARFKSE